MDTPTLQNDYLSIIRGYETESTLQAWRDNLDKENILFINGTSKTPIIQYYNSDGEVIDVSGIQSAISVVKTSNLEQELTERDWNISGRLFMSDGKLCLSNPEIGFKAIPSVSDLESSSTVIYPIESISSDEDEFNGWYDELINMKAYSKKSSGDGDVNLGGLYYFNLISCKDFIENSNVVDLLDLGNYSYTSTVNLNGLVNLSEPGNYLFVAGIEYTVDSESYLKEISFSPFKVTDENTLESNDLIVPVSEYITSDFKDNCYRVFPSSDKVTECIIGYCYIVFQPQTN